MATALPGTRHRPGPVAFPRSASLRLALAKAGAAGGAASGAALGLTSGAVAGAALTTVNPDEPSSVGGVAARESIRVELWAHLPLR